MQPAAFKRRKPFAVISSGPVYDPDAEIYFAQVVANGGAPLDTFWKGFWNNRIIALKARGSFTNFGKLCSMFNQHEIAARTSLVNPSQPMATFVNSPIFTAADGITTDGVSQYVNTEFISDANYTQNNNWKGYGIKDNLNQTAGGPVDLGRYDIASFADFITSCNFTLFIDSNFTVPGASGIALISNTTNLDADYFSLRTSFSFVDTYKNSTAGTYNYNSTTLTSLKFYMGALNNNNSPSNFKAGKYTWFGFGNNSINVADFITDFTSQLHL